MITIEPNGGRLRRGSVAALVVPVACSCLIVVMKVGDELGLSSFGLVAAVSVAVMAAVLAPWRPGGVDRAHRADLAIVIGLLMAAIGVWVRAVRRNLRIPVVFGVDPARHVSMTAWILDRRELPHGVDPLLTTLSNYPPGAHVVAAFVSWATGLSPLTSTWVVALTSVLVSMAVAAFLAVELTDSIAGRDGRAALAGLVTLCLLLVAWHFTVGLVTYEFFFSQSVGIAITVGGVLAVVMGARAGLSWWRWLPAASVAAIASFFVYPQQAMVVPLAVAAGLLACRRRRARSISARTVVLVLLGLVGAGGVALAVLDRAGYLSSGAAFGNGEGSITVLALSRIGGWVTVVLVAGGVVTLLSAMRRRIVGPGVLLAAAAAPVGLATGLWCLQHGVPVKAPVTDYRIAKNVYTAVPFLAAAAGVGVAVAVRSMRTLRAMALVALVLTLLIPMQPRILNSTRTPLVTEDAYDLARWAAAHHDPEDIGVAGAELEPFTLWYTGLRRRPYPDERIGDLVPRSTLFDRWPAPPRTEHYLLVAGERYIERYAARKGVTLERRLGSAALFRRSS